MKMTKLTALFALAFCGLFLQACCRPSEDAIKRSKRQTEVVENRQFIGGLSTLGALIQPILFMIGMANFMGRIPTFFNRVRDRFSSTLAGTGAPAGAGRRRRDVAYAPEMNHAMDMLQEAESKFNRQS